jgi:hypothetical protein
MRNGLPTRISWKILKFFYCKSMKNIRKFRQRKNSTIAQRAAALETSQK